jgi:ATP-dependent DNA helicase RecG
MEELDLARKTLIYEELFYLEVMVGQRAMERRAGGAAAPRAATAIAEVTATGKGGGGFFSGGFSPGGFAPLQRRLLERLPFRLTAGQEEAAGEINRDMAGPFPMARLLQGDVGSGKTLVSFLAALRAVDGPPGEARGQAAIMAPTELLARQHAENAAALLEPLGVRPAFLTGNLKAAGRAALLKNLAAGEIDILVGTHALFSRDVAYRNLRLVVVDEQHRFGVTQRQAIMAKGYDSKIAPGPPDLLMMSATPIPRTLALTVFGDLDVSIIPDLPPGRKPIKTHLARESNEDKVYAFVSRELAAGHQAYFVYPLIEAGDNRDMKDVESMAERLAREVFPRSTVALVHSKLDEEEKRKTMDAFRRGEIAVLAATSVVEVGVDVPTATGMVIEHAERFGLSALHQLRGRVGRGEAQAYCFLVYSDELTEDGKARLKVMLENANGFIIAEEDLKLRGPGQIAGIEQSGYLTLGIADPIRDAAELARARTDAFAMLEQDPRLESAEYRRVAETLRRAPPFARVVL